MWQVQLLLAVIGASLVELSVPWGPRCDLHSKLMPNTTVDSNQFKVQIPPSCRHGTVNWNRPMGTLRMRLTRPGPPFALCLETTQGTHIRKLTKVVDGNETEIRVADEGNRACTDIRVGEAELLIYAPEQQIFLSTMNFSVKPGKVS